MDPPASLRAGSARAHAHVRRPSRRPARGATSRAIRRRRCGSRRRRKGRRRHAVAIEGFDEAVADAGLPPVTVHASPFEVFRGRLGRRTPAEVEGDSWSADPAPTSTPGSSSVRRPNRSANTRS